MPVSWNIPGKLYENPRFMGLNRLLIAPPTLMSAEGACATEKNEEENEARELWKGIAQ